MVSTADHGDMPLVEVRATSIPRHADFHAELWNLLLATEKIQNCPFFAKFISHSRF